MMSLLKNLFVIIGLLLVAGLGFYLYSTGEIGPQANDIDFTLEAESAELVRRLNEVSRITIDSSVFSDPRFISLRSFASPVEQYPVGRSNPFLPSE